MPVAERAGGLVHYADVALLASALQDDLRRLARQLYLTRSQDRDGGAVAKKTLRAYFAAAGNASSAAAALGVNRRTVASRIAAIEESAAPSRSSLAADLEIALSLEAIEPPAGR